MNTTKTVVIDKKVNVETGAVTLFFKDEKIGPVVTGATEAEAKEKFVEALKVSLIVGSLTEINKQMEKNNFGDAYMREKADNDTSRLSAVKEALSNLKSCPEYEHEI